MREIFSPRPYAGIAAEFFSNLSELFNKLSLGRKFQKHLGMVGRGALYIISDSFYFVIGPGAPINSNILVVLVRQKMVSRP